MTNLRQQIEKIEACRPEHTTIPCEYKYNSCEQCRSDRICEAIKAKVEGMPRAENLYEGTLITGAAYKQGGKEQLEECKSYLMGELK